MSNIKVLDSKIFNRISAGEVVESPFSVVKELVENSIDARASSITITVEGGGINLISVKDSGVGISKGDIKTAFLPHATSKISSLDCLNAIATLGFRGEALPSIASVAEVSLISKRASDELGYSVSYEYGKLVGEGEIGASDGTVVSVKNLFALIPARKKFLKRSASEASRITDLVKKLILANPNISFKYALDGKVVFNTDGKGIESAVYAIYGGEIEQMTPIMHTMSGITLKGFASLPTFSKHNRTAQTIIVNNRVVENDEIAYSIFLAYKDFLMVRRYPVFVLYIEIPYDLVDVNVHPNKMQVKFVDGVGVKKMVYNAVKKLVQTHSGSTADLFGGDFAGELAEQRSVFDSVEQGVVASHSQHTFDGGMYTVRESAASINTLTRHAIMSEFMQEQDAVTARGAVCAPCDEQHSAALTADDHGCLISAPAANHQDFSFTSKISIIGKIFNTYIVLQLDNDIYLIDQHACHEKLLFDKYMAQINSKSIAVQPLLIPYSFTLEQQEADALGEALKNLNSIGFSIDRNNITFSLTDIPSILTNINLGNFVLKILQEPENSFTMTDILKEKIASLACKSAIKAGDELSKGEIELLLKQMVDNKTVPLCPHGRPIIVKLSKTQIESWFKRI